MPADLGSLRRSKVITGAGPGAVVDFRVGTRPGAPVSAVTAGLDFWDERASGVGLRSRHAVHEPRLEKLLGVRGFRLPPVKAEPPPWKDDVAGDELFAVRFPEWLQCPHCHRLQNWGRWKGVPGSAARFCPACSEQTGSKNVHVVPVRFVTACESGHLDEFPWHHWVRHRADCSDRKLKLESSGGTGLADLILECLSCGASRPMAGCFGVDALGVSCRGRRPWLPTDDSPCQQQRRTLQRGASNLYFPRLMSALDIPPWTDSFQESLGKLWGRIRRKETAQERRLLIELLELDTDLGMDLEDIVAEVETRVERIEEVTPDSLKEEEYRQFLQSYTVGASHRSDFEVHRASGAPELAPFLNAVVEARRLREVRVLTGFTRIHPPGEDEAAVAPIYDERPPWLPAAEIRGEGIFVELNCKRVHAWSEREGVTTRIEKLREPAQTRGFEDHLPRMLLAHSFAHALIRRLALECGYNAASLRERIYAGNQMCGVLIFTGTPDSEGTLGGLVRQAEETRFLEVVTDAIRDMAWCSSDPLCVTGVANLSEPTNRSACHNCLLLPETSCEHFNRFMDRALLVGTPDDETVGFFSPLLQR